MKRSVAAIRHVAFEGLGSFEAVLRKAGYDVRYYHAGRDDLSAPELREVDLLVVLGGPIGAYEEDRYPFLVGALRLLEGRLAARRPTLGLCLGAQLMARALGSRVYPGPAREIGFAPVTLTDAGLRSPLRNLGQGGVVLHWHGDTFDLPAGAALLASTDRVANQAFAIGPNLLGLQFHPEALAEEIEAWLVGHAAELGAAGLEPGRLRSDAARHGADLARRARGLMRDWIAGLVLP